MATNYSAKKEGYVLKYRTEATITPLADTYYFEVSLTPDEAGNEKISTWGLPRNRFFTVNRATENPMAPARDLAISYSNTHQAIIATIKDSLHNRNKVILEGIKLEAPQRVPPDVTHPFEDLIVIDIPTNIGTPGRPEIPDTGEREPVEVPRPIEGVDVAVSDRPIQDDIPMYELRQVTIIKK